MIGGLVAERGGDGHVLDDVGDRQWIVGSGVVAHPAGEHFAAVGVGGDG
jgi:hypothetical protein